MSNGGTIVIVIKRREVKMPVEVGKRYYFMTHAYHHVIAEVVEITGKREADVKDVLWIYSCGRNWEQFFQGGIEEDTVCFRFPDGSVSWFNAFKWNHPIPERGNAPSRGR